MPVVPLFVAQAKFVARRSPPHAVLDNRYYIIFPFTWFTIVDYDEDRYYRFAHDEQLWCGFGEVMAKLGAFEQGKIWKRVI